MPEKKQIKLLPIFAGIALVCEIICIFTPFHWIPDFFRFTAFLQMVGLGAVAFALFTNRRDVVIPAGLTLVTLGNLFTLVKYPIISEFLWLIGNVAITFFSVVELTNSFPQFKDKIKNLWFVPAAVSAVAFILYLLPGFSIYVFAILIPQIAATLLISFWIFNPNGLPYSAKKGNTFNTPTYEAYCDLLKHILLLLFTCGIWLLIWIYRMTGFTNAVKDEEERNPTNKFLLCLFVPFYQIYWTYKTAQRIDKMAAEKGIASDIATLCLILVIFAPIISPILMQEKMNAIVSTTPKRANKAPTTIEELRNYKDLLDLSVITQEEFDAKKKQLLGL